MNGRTPLMLSRISMGVTGTNEPGQVRPFDNAGGAAFSVAGAPTQSNEVLINGVPDTTWDKRLAYSPPQDAVQEVSVHAFESDAAYGHTGGGVVNQITKGGTNGFHGSIYEFNQVSKLYANYFFNNADGNSPDQRQLQPVRIERRRSDHSFPKSTTERTKSSGFSRLRS